MTTTYSVARDSGISHMRSPPHPGPPFRALGARPASRTERRAFARAPNGAEREKIGGHTLIAEFASSIKRACKLRCYSPSALSCGSKISTTAS